MVPQARLLVRWWKHHRSIPVSNLRSPQLSTVATWETSLTTRMSSEGGYDPLQLVFHGPTRIRTRDQPVMSRPLSPLSYGPYPNLRSQTGMSVCLKIVL